MRLYGAGTSGGIKHSLLTMNHLFRILVLLGCFTLEGKARRQGSNAWTSRTVGRATSSLAFFMPLRGGGIPLDHLTRAHYFDEEGNEVAPPEAARAPKPAKGRLGDRDAMLEHMEDAAAHHAEKLKRKLEKADMKGIRGNQREFWSSSHRVTPMKDEDLEGLRVEDIVERVEYDEGYLNYTRDLGKEEIEEHGEKESDNESDSETSSGSDSFDNNDEDDESESDHQFKRYRVDSDGAREDYGPDEEDDTSDSAEEHRMGGPYKSTCDSLSGDENYQRIKSIKDPEDFDSDDEGYNLNPFKGVQVPGWFLAENVDPPSKDPKIHQLNLQLWDACDNGDANEVLRLIEMGAEVNAADPRDWDWSALMHACSPPPAAGLPNVWYNFTAAQAERRHMRVVDCLMEHGARIDVTDIYGETPLHYAAVRGYPKLTRKLIELGVDIHRENMYGSSAQRIAEMNQKRNPGCWLAAEVIAQAGGYDAGWPGPSVCLLCMHCFIIVSGICGTCVQLRIAFHGQNLPYGLGPGLSDTRTYYQRCHMIQRQPPACGTVCGAVCT
jgi:hypothetical protein